MHRAGPYCEFKLVPGEIDELRSSLERDSSVVERIHERLMECLMEAGLKEDEAIKRIIDFMNYCKVAKVTLGETIKMY